MNSLVSNYSFTDDLIAVPFKLFLVKDKEAKKDFFIFFVNITKCSIILFTLENLNKSSNKMDEIGEKVLQLNDI